MPQHSKHDGFELFRHLGEDSPIALEAIMQQYKGLLVYYIRKTVKEDEMVKEVFMDTMQAVWTQRKTMIQRNDPVAWMIRIAHNKAFNKARDEKRPLTIPLENISYPIEDDNNSEATLEAKELQRLFQRAAEKLSPQEREIFRLSKTVGLDRKEIAAQFNISENTVRNQLASAIKKMHQLLSKLLNTVLI